MKMSLASIKSNWKLLGQDPKALAPAFDQIHRAVQFIAMAGKHYVKKQADDSHTNLRWLPEEEVLAGNWIRERKGNFRFAMHPKSMSLIVYNAGMEAVSEFTLHSKTNEEALEWIKRQLKAFGKDASQMKMDIHYDIPSHKTDNGAVYDLNTPELFQEIANYRANSNEVLEYFAQKFKTASTVRTWPHHFDISTDIPMVLNNKGEAAKSFSLGFAIADAVVDEPYFYITQWSANKDIDYTSAKPLTKGEWLPDTLRGTVLRASTVSKSKTTQAQASIVIQYFKEGVDASLDLIDDKA